MLAIGQVMVALNDADLNAGGQLWHSWRALGFRCQVSGVSPAAYRERPVTARKKLPSIHSAIIDCGRGFQPRFTLISSLST